MRPVIWNSAAAVTVLVLSLALGRTAAPAQEAVPRAGLDLAALRSGQIVAWISARTAGTYSPVVARSFAQDFPGGKLVEVWIAPERFVGQVQSSVPDDPPPDVAFIDNYRELQPLLEAGIVIKAWGRSRFPTRGWWVIFKNTNHLAQAEACVRWLNSAPGWQPWARNNTIPVEARDLVQKASIAAAEGVVSGDQATLETLLDSDAARSILPRFDPSAHVSDVQPIFTFGNPRVAFVVLSVLASSDSFYGMRQMIFIFRNQGDGWRILRMDPDASIEITQGVGNVSPPPLLRDFDLRIAKDQAEPPPPPAALTEPPDREVLPRFPHPEIAWESEAEPGARFIVEWQFTDPGDEVTWSVSGLAFAPVPPTGHLFREQAPFGVGKQPHRWRIWTLGPSGAISVSSWRTVLFSN
jgi:hypothetical protein